MDSLGLTDSVGAVLSLLVHCWVPISVEEDHTVRTSQIDSNATATRAADEAKKLWRQVESVNHFLTIFNLD